VVEDAFRGGWFRDYLGLVSALLPVCLGFTQSCFSLFGGRFSVDLGLI